MASDVHFFSSKPRVRKHNNSKDTNDTKNSKDRTLGDLHNCNTLAIIYLYASMDLTIIMTVMFQNLAFMLARSSRRRRSQCLKRLRKWMKHQQAMEGNPRGRQSVCNCSNFTVSHRIMMSQDWPRFHARISPFSFPVSIFA